MVENSISGIVLFDLWTNRGSSQPVGTWTNAFAPAFLKREGTYSANETHQEFSTIGPDFHAGDSLATPIALATSSTFANAPQPITSR